MSRLRLSPVFEKIQSHFLTCYSEAYHRIQDVGYWIIEKIIGLDGTYSFPDLEHYGLITGILQLMIDLFNRMEGIFILLEYVAKVVREICFFVAATIATILDYSVFPILSALTAVVMMAVRAVCSQDFCKKRQDGSDQSKSCDIKQLDEKAQQNNLSLNGEPNPQPIHSSSVQDPSADLAIPVTEIKKDPSSETSSVLLLPEHGCNPIIGRKLGILSRTRESTFFNDAPLLVLTVQKSEAITPALVRAGEAE